MDSVPETHDGPKPDAKVHKSAPPPVRSIWSIREIKRKLHERKAKHKHEKPEDRAARRTADATVWIAVFTVVLAIVGGITLFEIWQGGADTAKLAQAAMEQAAALKLQEQQMENIANAGKAQAGAALEAANAAQTTADAAKIQATATLRQVDKLDAGVRESHTLALAAQDQAKAAISQSNSSAIQADSTKALSQAAVDSYSLDEQAWIVRGIGNLILVPDDYSLDSVPNTDVPALHKIVPGKKIGARLSLVNIGKSPARGFTVRAYLAYVKTTTPQERDRQVALAFQNSKTAYPEPTTTLAMQSPYIATPIPIAPLTPADVTIFEKGNSAIVLTGMATYTDIFSRPHETEFCMIFTGETLGATPFNCGGYDDIK